MERSAHYEKKKETLYGEIAAKIELQILSGSYQKGERLPSLRQLSRRLGISINTAREAYGSLENRRIIEGRPQSGYYVRDYSDNCCSLEKPRMVQDDFLTQYNSMMNDFLDQKQNPFCSAVFELDALPWSNKLFLSREDQLNMNLFEYPELSGLYELRVEIARRSIDSGLSISPEEVIITEGGMAAISLIIKHFTIPGDTVALESPFYYNFLFLLREFGLRVIEIPAGPDTGMNLDILEFVISRHPVKAVITVPTNNNPTGSTMPDENKRKLVQMLEEKNILLLEDDIYGDVSFEDKQPKVCKAFDSTDSTILCSSFSKSLAPGLRLGWMVPGKHYEKVLAVKTMTNVATGLPSQYMALNFLRGGHYDRHMRQLNRMAAERMHNLREAVINNFPPEAEVTNPGGGFVLWINLPGSGDMNQVYKQARAAGVLFTPGSLFSLEGRWNSALRLSAGYYKPDMEDDIMLLGRIITGNWEF